jgi:hypothetical protein
MNICSGIEINKIVLKSIWVLKVSCSVLFYTMIIKGDALLSPEECSALISEAIVRRNKR